jgi:hypothetical protein
MMPTIKEAGTPYCFSALAKVSAWRCQNASPAWVRTGSMNLAR